MITWSCVSLSRFSQAFKREYIYVHGKEKGNNVTLKSNITMGTHMLPQLTKVVIGKKNNFGEEDENLISDRSAYKFRVIKLTQCV